MKEILQMAKIPAIILILSVVGVLGGYYAADIVKTESEIDVVYKKDIEALHIKRIRAANDWSEWGVATPEVMLNTCDNQLLDLIERQKEIIETHEQTIKARTISAAYCFRAADIIITKCEKELGIE